MDKDEKEIKRLKEELEELKDQEEYILSAQYLGEAVRYLIFKGFWLIVKGMRIKSIVIKLKRRNR